MNVRPRRSVAMHPDAAWHLAHWYEAPRDDPAYAEVYTYTDAMSYAPGETVQFHTSTTAPRWTLQVWRDGLTPTLVHEQADLPGEFFATPKGAYRDGCGWPAGHRWQLPDDLGSGFYRVVSICTIDAASQFVQHHWFVVRPVAAKPEGRFLLILPTATWTAYNDWGGANHYDGIDGPNGAQFSPILSNQRPWTRGLIWLPPGAPRLCDRPARRPGAALPHQGMGVHQWFRTILCCRRLGAVRQAFRRLGRAPGLCLRHGHADRYPSAPRIAGSLCRGGDRRA
jgi:hypothetical protein